jgi:hypothetical protein
MSGRRKDNSKSKRHREAEDDDDPFDDEAEDGEDDEDEDVGSTGKDLIGKIEQQMPDINLRLDEIMNPRNSPVYKRIARRAYAKQLANIILHLHGLLFRLQNEEGHEKLVRRLTNLIDEIQNSLDEWEEKHKKEREGKEEDKEEEEVKTDDFEGLWHDFRELNTVLNTHRRLPRKIKRRNLEDVVEDDDYEDSDGKEYDLADNRSQRPIDYVINHFNTLKKCLSEVKGIIDH